MEEHTPGEYYGSGDHIKNAIKKYGVESFRREVIAEYYDITKEEIKKIESDAIKAEWAAGHGEFNHSSNSYGGNILDGMPEEKAKQIADKRIASTRSGKGFSDMSACHTPESERKAGRSRSEYMKLHNSVERLQTDEARKKAMTTRKLNGTNDASRINTPEVRAKRNRVFLWFYNGVLVYKGKSNAAKRLMHLKNQEWTKGDELGTLNDQQD